MTRDQQLRHEVLTQAKAVGLSIALSVERLTKQARRAGFDYSPQEINEACIFLEEQGFLARIPDPATGVVLWKINSKGVLHCEQNGIEG